MGGSFAGVAWVVGYLGSGERWGLRGESEVVEDAAGHVWLGGEGDELEPAGATGALEDVDGEDLPQRVGPRDVIARAGALVHNPVGRREPELPPFAATLLLGSANPTKRRP
jgi:hypothetical protein